MEQKKKDAYVERLVSIYTGEIGRLGKAVALENLVNRAYADGFEDGAKESLTE